VNKLDGKGFSNTDDYSEGVDGSEDNVASRKSYEESYTAGGETAIKVKLKFMQMENIHSIRKSFRSMCKLCYETSSSTDSDWLSKFAGTSWLQHCSSLLNAAINVIQATNNNEGVLVHCSDGWDRTTQVVSLSLLLLEPQYRTILGFMRLIEFQWLNFGHRFHDRIGHGQPYGGSNIGTTNEVSPIFLQWIDSVYQVLLQFPESFEFNETFLLHILHHLYSCRFGTFLCNSDLERNQRKVKEKTKSLWDHLNGLHSSSSCYSNPLFIHQWEEEPLDPADSPLYKAALRREPSSLSPRKRKMVTKSADILIPASSVKVLRCWSKYFFLWDMEYGLTRKESPYDKRLRMMAGKETALLHELNVMFVTSIVVQLVEGAVFTSRTKSGDNKVTIESFRREELRHAQEEKWILEDRLSNIYRLVLGDNFDSTLEGNHYHAALDAIKTLQDTAKRTNEIGASVSPIKGEGRGTDQKEEKYDRDSSSESEDDLVNVPSTPDQKRPWWKPNSSSSTKGEKCTCCGSSFSLFVRKHHCRMCGNLVCDPCSGQKKLLPRLGYHGTKVRVCDTCDANLTENPALIYSSSPLGTEL
jgi:hypothetical protein